MFRLTKTLGLAAVVSLGLMISGCGKKPEQAKSTETEKKHTPSWLFVVHAESGTITQQGEKEADSSTEQAEKKYTLTLTKTDDDHVIAFTDRPDRKVVYETAKKLEMDWYVGDDSFKQDPPNAVLSSAHLKHPVIVVLDSMKSDGKKTTFTFHSAEHNPTDDILGEVIKNKHQLTNVVVTIDSILDGLPSIDFNQLKSVASDVSNFVRTQLKDGQEGKNDPEDKRGYSCGINYLVCKHGYDSRQCSEDEASKRPCPVCTKNDTDISDGGCKEYTQWGNCPKSYPRNWWNEYPNYCDINDYPSG